MATRLMGLFTLISDQSPTKECCKVAPSATKGLHVDLVLVPLLSGYMRYTNHANGPWMVSALRITHVICGHVCITYLASYPRVFAERGCNQVGKRTPLARQQQRFVGQGASFKRSSCSFTFLTMCKPRCSECSLPICSVPCLLPCDK
jgi:hypothetical protein